MTAKHQPTERQARPKVIRPYPPHPAPGTPWLFSKVKMTLKGKSLEWIRDIKAARTAQLKTVRKEHSELLQKEWAGWDECAQRKDSILRKVSGSGSLIVRTSKVYLDGRWHTDRMLLCAGTHRVTKPTLGAPWEMRKVVC